MTPTPFNFQKPGPLATSLEHQFATWLRTVCALATRKWQKELPGSFELQLRGLETYRAGDVLAALPDGIIGYRIALHEKLPTLLIWPRALVLGLIGALLCDAPAELPGDRELTLVEESLFEFFLKDLLLPSFLETWTGPAPIRPEIGVEELHPRWVRLYRADESVVACQFLLKGPFGEHEWRWLLPKKGLLESILPGSVEAEGNAAAKERLEGLVRALPVEVTITLGTVEVHLSQLAQLRPGDVLLLDQRINQPLPAQVAGRKKMCGWPVRLGNRQAFQVEELEK